MAEKKKRLEKLTISLLKEGLGRDDVLRKDKEVAGHRVRSIDKTRDSLFTDAVPLHPSKWVRYLDPHTTTDLKETLFSASASAVLILEASERVFAITWGQGRHLIDSDNFVQDFGLKVVLNTVAPDQLKSVDAKTIDETTVHTRRDVSRDSNFAAFGLDPIRDLLRAVTGTPRDSTLAHRLTGSDALGIHTREQVPDLPALAARLLGHYEEDAYKENFDFIDFLRPVKSHALRSELDDSLLTTLNEARTDRDKLEDLHLAVPETIDWLENSGFRYETSGGSEEEDNDPRITAYLDSYDEDLDFKDIKNDRLLAVRASDNEIAHTWSIYKSLVYQTELKQGEEKFLYVLSGGEWFQVADDYRMQVEADVEALARCTDLPDADHGAYEDEYNEKAAASLGALCLDKKFIYDGGPDKMEICDILTKDGRFIHVKMRGSSSTLSHLFTQGTNSGERLLIDDDFRARARKLIKGIDPSYADVIPAARPVDPTKFEATFAVVTRSERKTPLTLPFFSVISLRAATQRLQAFGIKVTVAAVPEV
jgi:uncharacterized protein (TIGR04141 family)